jgi:hypothetical protein
MLRRLCTLIVLAGVFGTTPLWAAQLSRPQVEYSADETMQTEDMTMEQHIYATPTKERKEMLTESSDGVVQIFRYDNKVILQLMPSQNMYMEHSIGQNKSNDPSQWDFEETVVGEEVMNGMKVTKYKTIATSTDGKKYGGFSWRTKEGISIKSDLLYKEGNEKHRMMTELKNVKVGKQDPKLFEVPEGFTKFDMAGMMGGGMMGGAMSRERMNRPGMGQPGMGKPDMSRQRMGRPDMPVPPGDAPMSTEPSADDRSDIQKAGEAMKKLFGR